VYERDLDTVVGTVHVCDLLRERDYGAREPDEIELTDVMQPTIHVPEAMPADEVLAEMQRAQVHIAVIIDEYGTTEGIVTTEDPTEVITRPFSPRRTVRFGEPDSAIFEYAEDHGVDRIIIGSHCRTSAKQFLLGSAAGTIVKRAPIPVMIVR
jgi:nucleotide-binding universal stress UspA family protein